ncbi:MAG: helix-turn-helix domain-containing protein [Clostridiales bacterium]|nr:helix-turn-helix domain-containing protein [Clostridiales bacterium]
MKIKLFLVRERISQKSVSQRTGIPQPKLSTALNGKCNLTCEEFSRIVKVLGVSADTFIEPTDNNNELLCQAH